jgi:hypothetical protein
MRCDSWTKGPCGDSVLSFLFSELLQIRDDFTGELGEQPVQVAIGSLGTGKEQWPRGITARILVNVDRYAEVHGVFWAKRVARKEEFLQF